MTQDTMSRRCRHHRRLHDHQPGRSRTRGSGGRWLRWLGGLLAALLLGLTGCHRETGRIVTPLTPGEHTAYVELSDGYLDFFEEQITMKIRSREISLSYATELGPVRTYQQVVEELGFDPGLATAHLPAYLQLGEDSYAMGGSAVRLKPREGYPDGPVAGGYEFSYYGDGFGNRKPALILLIYHADAAYALNHLGYLSFRVFPWVRVDQEADRQFSEPFLAYRPSQVGDVTVGALHLEYPARTTKEPLGVMEHYYAGFYIGDLAFALEMKKEYCTQEEFIQVLLALIDGAKAQGVG